MEFQPMSPEEMQRTMQFLLHQQAQFAADSAESQAQFAADSADSQARFDAQFTKLSGAIDQVAGGLIGLTATVGRVVDSVGQIAEQAKNTNARVDDLGEYIKTVESHLNIVIEMFERHLREDHGHRPS